jgi:hypothetical protein
MGCGGGKEVSPDEDKDFQQWPVKKRGCTDIICLICFIVHWLGFFAVSFAGVADGNPTKLYKPRDFRGEYCGAEKNWNDGLNLDKQVMQTFTMNVTSSVNEIAMQLVCSTVAETELNALMTADQITTYRCACCKSACSTCFGSLNFVDLKTVNDMDTEIGGKMAGLNGQANAGVLFSPNGPNGDYYSNMWETATKYFNRVCMKLCNDPYTANLNSSTDYRTYLYTPPPDYAWKEAWDVLTSNGNISSEIRDVIASSFTFRALPTSKCPYHERYCVPFPGIDFSELANNYCTFKQGADVINAVGQSAAETFDSLGANDAQKSLEESFGSAMGDAIATIDALIVVSICSLVIGLVFLVLLRFFVGCVVWCSLFTVLLVFAAAGGFLWIRSAQCKGAGMFESGKQMGQAATLSAVSTASNTLGGTTGSEDMTGNGADYRGVQKLTKDGLTCQRWDAQSPHSHSMDLNDTSLVENYCRNPTTAPTIWCYTVDPKVRWQTCTPIGVIRPECEEGYVVESETGRKIMEVMGVIIWCCGVFWIILICCLQKRIRLAIAINKTAAMFVYNTPQIIAVPLVQVFVGITWVCLWAFLATFLLSQVPDGYTPTNYYATWQIAHGTDDDPGKCTDKWPTGGVWKDDGDPLAASNPCSGAYGSTAGMTPMCFRCYPPRYIFDARFAYQFFSLLWNNAFLIALGQCIIAGSVCVWFFAAPWDKFKVASVSRSTKIALRYHSGTMAFGAFILAVVQFIRWIAYYFEKQAEAQKNKVMQIVLKIVQCCLWCLEKCIKFLNKNAYIQTAIKGTNFCRSAKNAFGIITKNFVRFGVVATLGTVIYYLGFVFIMCFTSLMGYFILQGLHPDIYPAVPLVMYVVVSYLVAKLYMNVFGLAVDTILQLFIEIEDQGFEDGDFIPGPLKSFIKKAVPPKDDKYDG